MDNENKGTPILTGDEEEELTDPAEMLLPTRAELEAKQAKEAEDAENADNTGSDNAGEGDSESAGGDDSTGASGQTVAETQTLFVPEVTDPGEFTPNDYSFELQVFDEKNENPKTVKIDSPEAFDRLMDTEPNLGSTTAVTKAIRSASKMESGLERDKKAYDEAKSKFDADQAEANAANANVEALENGLNYLVEKGELPKVPARYINADWNDPKVAEQSGVKEQLELLNYMAKENKARVKAGLQEFGSVVDAWNQMDRENARQAAKEAQKNAGEARRQASMRVGAPAPAPVSNIPKGVSVGRSLGSLDNL